MTIISKLLQNFFVTLNLELVKGLVKWPYKILNELSKEHNMEKLSIIRKMEEN